MEASKTGNKNVDRPQNRDHECVGFVGAAERARHFAAASLSDPYSDPRWAARHSAAMTDRHGSIFLAGLPLLIHHAAHNDSLL